MALVHHSSKTLGIVYWPLLLTTLFAGLVFLGLIWWSFHPSGVTPVVGPAGSVNRAYIENRSFGDMSFVLCVSDWPRTLFRPISVESVIYSEGSNSRVFWSADGSVLVVRTPTSYVATYDYLTHELLRYGQGSMHDLIQSRGGLGPEQPRYPDGKGAY